MSENRTPPRPPKGPPHGGPGGGPRGGFGKPKDLKGTVLRMSRYIAVHPILLVLVLFCILASSLSNVAATYMLRPIINSIDAARIAGAVDVEGLFRSCALLLIIYLVAAVCTYLQANLMARVAQKGCNRLRRDLFDKLQELPLGYFDSHPHGELMSRFTNDADNVQMALEQSVVQLFSSIITFVGTVVMMLYLSPVLFLSTLAMLAAVMTVFAKRGKKSREFFKKQQATLGAVNGNIQEMIEGMKVVKAFTHEEPAKARFNQLNEEFRAAASNAVYFGTSVMPISGSITNMGYAVTAALGGVLALSGFDVGGLGAYLNYNRQVSQPISQISMQLNTLLSALAGAERIFQVMDTKPELDNGTVVLVPASKDANGNLTTSGSSSRSGMWAWKTPRGIMELVPVFVGDDGTLTEVDASSAPEGHRWAWKYPSPDGKLSLHLIRGAVRNVPGENYYLTELRGAVRLSQVNFSYVEGKQVLKEVSVYANPGQKIAFVGSTGAGKTTITNLINRFYEIQGGLITCDGIDVRLIDKDSLRLSQGSVLQDTHLFTGTVMENIRYGRLDATDEECIQAAIAANADSFIRRLPDGYQTHITGDGANLSQGQRQLLAIARAAVKDPPIMVLDEATSSIDTRTEHLIQKGMDTLMQGRTVFVIAHRLSTVRNSDCIVVIEHGQIMEKGSHEELLELKGRYHQLYTGQFELD